MSKVLPALAFLALCVACGSKFEPGGSGDAGGTGADAGDDTAGGSDQGGSSGTAQGGDDSAGAAAAPEGGADSAGAPSGGAHSGGAHSGGAPSGGAPSGGAPGGGAGGASAGAGGASAGAGGAPDCATLISQYEALVEKARVCDPAATDQCSPSSTLPPIGCGCPTPVNAKSQSTSLAKVKYDQIQKNKCNNGPICGIACIPSKFATCSPATGTSTKSYVCTTTQGGIAN